MAVVPIRILCVMQLAGITFWPAPTRIAFETKTNAVQNDRPAFAGKGKARDHFFVVGWVQVIVGQDFIPLRDSKFNSNGRQIIQIENLGLINWN